jgi:hypothetical protein
MTTTAIERSERMKWRVFDLLLTTLLAVNIGLVGWTAMKVIDVSETVAAITANRFTSADGLEVWKEISNLREHLAAFPSEIPPEWFKQEVGMIHTMVNENRERLIRLEALLNGG